MKNPRRRARAWVTALIAAFALAVGCGRSGLDADDFEWIDGQRPAPDAAVGGGTAQPDAQTTECVPAPETCNGVDDDCNGQIDELTPKPCAEGGEQYCVAGAWSACPERCEACMPGSERVCFLSYCKYWAVQTCTTDGKSFGKCHEEDPPAECKSVAKDKKYSSDLEECCVDNGYCCLDTFDLDDDGNTGEMLGECEDVLCKP
ncbi:MAG: hypothetical protein IPI67_22000 [Myxococcales bacterium]|nr:hypothetical protein [Myxococcales bacterium]